MASQKLMTKEISRKLTRQWSDEDAVPHLKIFNPCGAATWLFSEQDPDDPDRLFGLCDMGDGCPELGYASLSELARIRVNIEVNGFVSKNALPLERDKWFKGEYPISVYAAAAKAKGRITELREDLEASVEQATAATKALRRRINELVQHHGSPKKLGEVEHSRRGIEIAELEVEFWGNNKQEPEDVRQRLQEQWRETLSYWIERHAKACEADALALDAQQEQPAPINWGRSEQGQLWDQNEQTSLFG